MPLVRKGTEALLKQFEVGDSYRQFAALRNDDLTGSSDPVAAIEILERFEAVVTEGAFVDEQLQGSADVCHDRKDELSHDPHVLESSSDRDYLARVLARLEVWEAVSDLGGCGGSLERIGKASVLDRLAVFDDTVPGQWVVL